MSRMRVLMAGPLPPAVGGMASVIDALLHSSLAESCALSPFNTGKQTPEGRSLASGIKARLSLMRQWWAALGQTDVAHIHTCSGLTFFLDGLLLVLARVRGRPVVLHVHGAQFDAFLDGLPGLGRALARSLARGAHVVIVLSPEWETRLSSRLPGARLAVVRNGVDQPRLPAREARTDKGLHLLLLGNLGRRKGVPVLLDAIARPACATVRLTLAGGEEDPGALAQTRERVAGSDRIQCPGPVVGQAKLQLLADADAFVLPSLAEGLPMALLEAMAAGLPCIVSSVGAMPEVIRHGETGLVVPPDDVDALESAIVALGAMPEATRKAMGAAAQHACAGQFGVGRMAEAILDVYRRVSSAAPQGRT